jgi:CBS domain-containing protein
VLISYNTLRWAFGVAADLQVEHAKEAEMTFVRQLLQGKPAEVWTIGPQATVYEALELLADKNIGAVPVVEDGELIGMFSERDYARKVILRGKASRETAVRELMSHPVFRVGPEETIETCMALMTTQHIRHLPVIEHGQLIGLVSIGDILKTIIANQQVLIQDLENFIVGARS